jgi:rubredoxin
MAFVPPLGTEGHMAHRECPECGEQLKVSVEHLSLMPDRPKIASPRWDCQACGWSLAFDPSSGEPQEG